MMHTSLNFWHDPAFWNAVTFCLCAALLYRPVMKHLQVWTADYQKNVEAKLQESQQALEKAQACYAHALSLQSHQEDKIAQLRQQTQAWIEALHQSVEQEVNTQITQADAMLKEKIQAQHHSIMLKAFLAFKERLLDSVLEKHQKDLEEKIIKAF